jgi:hypothetical protein
MYICKIISKWYFILKISKAKLNNKYENAIIPVHKLDEFKVFQIKHKLILYK